MLQINADRFFTIAGRTIFSLNAPTKEPLDMQ